VEPGFAGEVEPVIWDYKFKQRKANSNSMSNAEIRQHLVDNPDMKESRRVEFRSEITKRYSFSMACLAFAFVAVPLSLKSRRKDTSTGLILSLLLGAGYFLFTVLSAEFKTDLGATAVLWLPNVLCVLIGLFLFRRTRFK
jgi:lipopolysaccharide export system permease protein